MSVKLIVIFLGVLAVGSLSACRSAINNAKQEAKYSAYEFFGIEKRDLFKKEVKKVRTSQEDTGEAFEDALEQLKAIYGLDGGKLEKQYRSLNAAYEDAAEQVKGVHDRVLQLETVAADLFKEWRAEIGQIESGALRAKSSESLAKTQKKYAEFHGALKKSEAQMDPVLRKLRDQVLFLKHNLNAQAITGLKTESGKIQNDISSLIKEMNASISQADEFIKTMD